MTKVRVHELAKELGMENKELVDLLQKKNVDVKNHMSTLEEDVASQIRKERAGQAEKKEEKPEGENAAQGADKADGAPKKKNLAYVIRPQNSRNSSRIQGNRQGQRGQRPAQGGGRPAADGRQSRPERGDRPARPVQAGRPAGEQPLDRLRPALHRDRHPHRLEHRDVVIVVPKGKDGLRGDVQGFAEP